MAERPLRIGILDTAHMHAHAYAALLRAMPDVELAVVADRDDERGQTFADSFHTIWQRDYQEALRVPLDGVIVASANAGHRELVLAAAEAGLPVLCEKPLALSEEDGHAMVSACRARGVPLAMAFPMRYSTPIRRLKQQIAGGALGRLLVLNGTNRGQNPGGWFVDPALSGGGAVMDHTVHVIDVMRWYTGSEVREVYAEVDRRFGARDVDDTGLLTLEFENGVIAAHDPSWSRPARSFPTWGDVTLEVVGTDGAARVDAFAERLDWFHEAAGKLQHVRFGDDPDQAMLEDFLTVIRTGTAPSANGWDGLQATRVALAAYESARKGQPVTLTQEADGS